MNRRMLTLDFQAYCAVRRGLSERLSEPACLGGAGPLTLVLVSRGQCGIPEADPITLAQAGHLILSAGPVYLEPMDEVDIVTVTLAGLAPADLAGQLSSPILLDANSSPEITDLMHQLAEVEAGLSAIEAGLSAYNLLGRLTTARPAAAGRWSALTAAAISEIHHHYAEIYGVEELARKLGVSKHHLIRVFTANTGRTPGRHLTMVRLAAVKRALTRFDYSLEVIAGLCGFANAHYLGKVFKKETGFTPAAWRAQKKEPAADSPAPTEWEEMIFL